MIQIWQVPSECGPSNLVVLGEVEALGFPEVEVSLPESEIIFEIFIAVRLEAKLISLLAVLVILFLLTQEAVFFSLSFE